MSAFHQSSQWKRARQWALAQWAMSGHPPCPICNKPINEMLDKVHVDHPVPVSEGGPAVSTDLRVVHAECNLRRDRGGMSYSAGRRRARKQEAGWQMAPEDAARTTVAVLGPSREW